MEEKHKIEGPDGNLIYGTLRKALQPAKQLVIHLHGMTHHQHFLLEVLSADYFARQGYDHFRFSFYEIAPQSRTLPQTTLSTLAADTRAVLEHFHGQYEEIFITGHSLAALTLLMVNPPGIKAMSLWDPAFDVATFWEKAQCLTHIPERREYHLNYGNVFVISEEFVREIDEHPDAHCRLLAQKMKTPVQLVIPEESIFLASPHTSPEAYGDCFAGSFEVRRLKAANHRFSYEGNTKRLLKLTGDWFKKHG